MRTAIAVFIALTLVAAASAKDDDPVALVTALYQPYLASDPSDVASAPGLSNVYSKRLQALLDKDERESPEGEVGRLDFEVVVDGQDWQLSDLKIAPVSRSAAVAEVRATFKNFDEPKSILYRLTLEDGHWRIDDIEETLQPRWVPVEDSDGRPRSLS